MVQCVYKSNSHSVVFANVFTGGLAGGLVGSLYFQSSLYELNFLFKQNEILTFNWIELTDEGCKCLDNALN